MRQRGDEEELGELDELERRETEKGEVLDFEPLSADVAPQMTLFGPAPTAPRRSRARAAPMPMPVPVPLPRAGGAAEASVPLFERRAQLRAKRHRLVAELARDRRSRHGEVNAEVNRALGIESVDKATIEQLERSIEWLDRSVAGSAAPLSSNGQ